MLVNVTSHMFARIRTAHFLAHCRLSKMRLNLCFVLIYVVLCEGIWPSKKPKKPREQKTYVGPQNFNVVDKKLIVTDPHAKDILRYNEGYFQNTTKWTFPGMVLGYVTPWNKLGYDIAKLFANKFTHISPAWFEVKYNEEYDTFDIIGKNHIDKNWIQDVRNAGKKRQTRIVPRVLFDSWTQEHAIELVGGRIKEMAIKFITLCDQGKFDGLVLEVWNQLADRLNRHDILELIKRIGKQMSEENLDMILGIPADMENPESPVDFSSVDFVYLQRYVTGFSLMTYDFSSVHRPGVNAPFEWVEQSIRHTSEPENRKKTLTGLNFYGMMYTAIGGGPIFGKDYINALKTYNATLRIDIDAKENFFEVRLPTTGKSFVFYPTLYSVYERITLAKQLNTGLSIWELGQGLNYFYDLL